MIKDVYVFKKKIWHARMMNYIWGFKPTDFSHMCPYWWLSIANIFILPFKFVIVGLLGKGVMHIIAFLGDKLDYIMSGMEDYYNKKFDEWAYQEYVALLASDPKTIDNLIKTPYKTACGKKYDKFLSNYVCDHNWELYQQIRQQRSDYWDAYYSEMRAQAFAKERERMLKIAEIPKPKPIVKMDTTNVKVKINKVFKFIKPIAQALLIIAGGVVAICLLYLIYLLFAAFAGWLASIKIATWTAIGKILLLGISGTAIIAGAILLAVYLNKRWKFKIPCEVKEAVANNTSKFFRTIAKPFIWAFKRFFNGVNWIWDGIANIFTFLIQMMKDNCPAIKWEDE